MDKDIIIGTTIIILGLSFLTYLVWWSKRTIELIANKRLASAREITKELKDNLK